MKLRHSFDLDIVVRSKVFANVLRLSDRMLLNWCLRARCRGVETVTRGMRFGPILEDTWKRPDNRGIARPEGQSEKVQEEWHLRKTRAKKRSAGR